MRSHIFPHAFSRCDTTSNLFDNAKTAACCNNDDKETGIMADVSSNKYRYSFLLKLETIQLKPSIQSITTHKGPSTVSIFFCLCSILRIEMKGYWIES